MSAIPPHRGAPDSAQPIAQEHDPRVLAPWPQVDKYPQIQGQALSLATISSAFRTSLTGYRQGYVDLLEELLEGEPHGFSVLQKRVLGVAGGKIQLEPCKVLGSRKSKQAEKIAEQCEVWLNAIPNLTQHLAFLEWAIYYAIEALETHWDRSAGEWWPARFSMIHSRRLAYPQNGSWDLCIWDQGQVTPWDFFGAAPTTRTFGLRIADYPGKFIVHAPQVRGSYPTREGLGRELAYWIALKRIASRNGAQYLERFAKPWPEATYSTGPKDAPGRVANTEDIASAQAAIKALGLGSLSGYVHPDTIELNLRTPDNGSAAKLTYTEWISLCNAEISKAVLGGTLGTDVGHTGGNRALGDTQRKSELALLKYDAKLLAETLRRDLIGWMVRLNFPNDVDLVPHVAIHVEDDPSPTEVIERAAKAVAIGMPVDADELAEQVGLKLVDADDEKARRLYPAALIDPAAVDADIARRAHEVSEAYPNPNQAAPGESANAEAGEGNDADEPADASAQDAEAQPNPAIGAEPSASSEKD